MNRNLIQNKNIIFGLLFKGIGVSLNLLIIPLLISYLGKIEYGIWITLFSVINWVFTFDLGIGTGLRNKLTSAFSLNQKTLASKIISTSYILISFIAILIFLFGIIFIFLIDIQSLINYNGVEEAYLKNFFLLALFFTVINFILSLYKRLYLAVHKSYFVEMLNTIFLMLYTISIYFLIISKVEKNLISLIIIFGSISLLVSLFATLVFFRINKKIELKFSYFNKNIVRSLIKLGGKFFLINLSLLILLLTDNIIISNLLGPSSVTDYSVVQKIFQLLIMIFTIVIASSWSLYSDAIVKNDFQWVRKNIRRMHVYLLLVFSVALLFYFYIDDILDIWLGKKTVDISIGLALAHLIYFAIFSFTNIYMFFINATGKIKLQMYLYIFGALINIPLSIYFVKQLNSSTGVILSTIICIFPLVIIMPLQTNSILKEMAAKVIRK